MTGPAAGRGRPASLVMARAPRPGRCKTRLEPLLGPEGCAALQAALTVHAAAWAARAAPGAAFVAFDPPDALDEVGALVPAGTDLFPQSGADLGARLAAATARVFAHHEGPLLVIGTDAPALADRHAAAALDDLASGCQAVFGPAFDGGYYLVGLDRPRPELFRLVAETWGGPQVLRASLEAAGAAGLEIGLIDLERDLDTPEDARAWRADPACPPAIAARLGGAPDRRPA